MSEAVQVGAQSEIEKNISLYNKIARVKNEIGVLKKDASNPFYKSKYLSLPNLLAQLEPLLLKNRLILLQPCHCLRGDGSNMVVTELRDLDTGAMTQSSYALPNLDDMQKSGGSITYARRYTLEALLGLQTEDDDGNLASGKSVKKRAKKVTNGDF